MKPQSNILLVEDDEDDLFLAQRILKKAGFTQLHHAADGLAAIDYLAGRGDFSDRRRYPVPDVMFVDLKLPKINGHQVVEWAVGQAALKNVRIFVLSSSGEDRDRQRARAAGAAGYLVKPLTAADLARVLGPASGAMGASVVPET